MGEKNTKTYKSKKIPRNMRKIRINARENRTEKIHKNKDKKSAKKFSTGKELLYKEAPPTARPHTFGGFLTFAFRDFLRTVRARA
jgi:hypothetical protein